ncbi:hydrogenase/reductase-like protein [Penicillium brasilianum]|uniref:Hydrogenase/reductase-like protein n=1 Tax=Penicillium brasilianum TaxID=104259 RepID=A0A1S9RGY4_PENBI|nr:hydrogenase/reductase-like protein [Penicillium brasilianum]
MVSLSVVESSNASISKELPPGLVAVFVGATSGIGKATLLQLAKYVQQPRFYFVGRSQSAADEILDQLDQINPDGRYEFIKADASLLSVVDTVCETIRKKETQIDILFQSQGTLDVSTETSERLPLIMALSYYSRMRFIANLLPWLQRSSLGQVVTVLAGTKEGPVNPNDIPGKKVLPWKARGHLCSMITLTLERFSELAPGVSFVHNYPGFVATPLAKSMKGATGAVMRSVFWFTGLFSTKVYVSLDETGERHCFLATSSRFSSKTQSGGLLGGTEVAIGSDGAVGSGVYIVDEVCESGDANVQNVLSGIRRDGIHQKIWEHLQNEFLRVTGKSAIQ